MLELPNAQARQQKQNTAAPFNCQQLVGLQVPPEHHSFIRLARFFAVVSDWIQHRSVKKYGDFTDYRHTGWSFDDLFNVRLQASSSTLVIETLLINPGIQLHSRLILRSNF